MSEDDIQELAANCEFTKSNFDKNSDGSLEEDEFLEVRSESAFPIRPPVPHRKGAHSINLSLNEADFPSNTRGQAVYANQVNQIDNTQWRKFKRQIEQIKLKKTKIHLADDQGTVLSTSTTEQDEDDDISSAMLVSSTETVSEPDSTTRNLPQHADMYLHCIESSSIDNSPEYSKTSNRRDSDYSKVYDEIQGKDILYRKIKKNEGIRSEDKMNRTENLKDGLGVRYEDGGGGHQVPESQWLNQADLVSTVVDEEVNINVPAVPDIQHLHIQINLNFATEKPFISRENVSVRPNETVQVDRSTKQTGTHNNTKTNTKPATPVRRESRDERKETLDISSENAVTKPQPNVERIRGRRETLPSKLAEGPSSISGRRWNLKIGKLWKSKSVEKEYDEISVKDGGADIVKSNGNGSAAEDETREKTSHVVEKKEAPDTGQPSWMFHHSLSSQAQGMVKTDQNGSFVILHENEKIKPFTPYTLLVIHDGELIRIPIVKQPQFPVIKGLLTKQGTLLARDNFWLATSPNHKMKSIEDIVAYYQKHEIPGIKLKLKLP